MSKCIRKTCSEQRWQTSGPGARFGASSFGRRPAVGVAELHVSLQNLGGDSGSLLMSKNRELAALIARGVGQDVARGPAAPHIGLLADTLKEFGTPKTGWWKVVSDGRVTTDGITTHFDVSRIDARMEYVPSPRPQAHPIPAKYAGILQATDK